MLENKIHTTEFTESEESKKVSRSRASGNPVGNCALNNQICLEECRDAQGSFDLNIRPHAHQVDIGMVDLFRFGCIRSFLQH
jgi:hypothetical protein